MEEVVVADIGGTHARFAIATVENGHVISVAPPHIVNVAAHDTLASAWNNFREHLGRPSLPKHAALAVACPVHDDVLVMANNPWTIVRAELPAQLGVEDTLLLNDFEAVAYAVAHLDINHQPYLSGPDRPLPEEGTILTIGPGTGLGTAIIIRRQNETWVSGAEGGHIGFSPCDEFEDRLMARLRTLHGRVSAERVICGPGIIPICAQLAEDCGEANRILSDKQLWTLALEGHDRIATQGMARFCQALGSFAGDMALAHGATGIVIAGGLGKRLMDILPASDFGHRFVAKGRFETVMRKIPVRMIQHPEPGLFGAACALAMNLKARKQA
ncbi:glucokinase [Acetobacter conturbans]|uniref:Glucokinase n=1 Tax=Acetobacter conturbans TaxID=1737472 RepID=A0ABX0K347_9PROT|nr:glucokinase [Acetobacter conturbans]NHN89685.1 glucokinase [Acetobacter conturbans]